MRPARAGVVQNRRHQRPPLPPAGVSRGKHDRVFKRLPIARASAELAIPGKAGDLPAMFTNKGLKPICGTRLQKACGFEDSAEEMYKSVQVAVGRSGIHNSFNLAVVEKVRGEGLVAARGPRAPADSPRTQPRSRRPLHRTLQ